MKQSLMPSGLVVPLRSGKRVCACLSVMGTRTQALSRQIRTIGELCTRRLDRICRVDILQQGNHGQGLDLHSAMVGKYIDVSCPFVCLNWSY